MSDKILPCPFCSGRAERPTPDAAHGGMVQCISCGASAFGPKWNRRSPNAAPEGFALVPFKMTAAMINAWSGGITVTSDEIAYHSSFQNAWSRVLAASPPPPIKREDVDEKP